MGNLLRVNILGGRDVGKTTIAMHAAAELRWMGVPTAVNYELSGIWPENAVAVVIEVYQQPAHNFTPHSLSEWCDGAMNFLVRRPKDYVAPMEWIVDDEKLEDMMREVQVRYKSLPGCRASVQYVIKKICDAIGYGK